MATLQNAIDFARAETQTDSNGLTDANGIIFSNEALLDYRRKLLARGVDASQVQETTRDGTVDTGTYLYPTDMFWLKTIELNYKTTAAADYLVANQLDVSNIPGGKSYGWLRANASVNEPWFDDRGDWYEIFPTPTSAHNVTTLIKLIYYLEPTEYTATSDTISYPESLDYRVLGWRIAANYLRSLEKYDGAAEFDALYEQKVEELISTLSRGSQQPIQTTGLGLTGFEF